MAAMREMMEKLKLTVNEAKTQLRTLPDESVDFLGYTIGRCYSPRTGRAYVGTCPSRKAVQRVCREISDMTQRRWLLLDAQDRVARINWLLRGWSNYFCLGPVSKAYRSVDASMAAQEAQGAGRGDGTLPRRVPVPGAGTPPAPGAYAQLPVGDRVSPCPKAGCGKTACPV